MLGGIVRFIPISIEHSASKQCTLIRCRTICLCPTKRTLCLYGLNAFFGKHSVRVYTIYLDENRISDKNYIFFLNLEIITCDPLLYTMDHPKFIVAKSMVKSPVCLTIYGQFVKHKICVLIYKLG